MKEALGTRGIAGEVAVSDRQVRNWLSGRDTPHAGASGNRQRTERAAVAWASAQLWARGCPVPSDPHAVLYAQLTADARKKTR